MAETVLAFWKITLAIREQRIDERRQEVQMGTRMVDVGVKRETLGEAGRLAGCCLLLSPWCPGANRAYY